MRPIWFNAAVPLLWLAASSTGSAQGFSIPGATPGVPGAPQGQAAPAPQSGIGTQMLTVPPTQPSATGQRPGFAQTPPTQPSQPAQTRQNYADELTDFGIPPQAELQDNVGSPTPTTIPGAHVITTAEMRQAVGSNILFVDVLGGPAHQTLPGALTLPGMGDGGNFDDAIQQQLWTALSQATQMNPDRPIVFFCAGARCWESYNAALRAVQMGFKTVLWYRGGLAAWRAAGLPLNNAGGSAPAPQRPRPGFGAAPG